MSRDESKMNDKSAESTSSTASSTTSSTAQDSDTLIEIQTRLEFQDLTIAELNEVITDQQRQLDQLNARLELMGDKLSVVEESTEGSQGNEKPPHY